MMRERGSATESSTVASERVELKGLYGQTLGRPYRPNPAAIYEQTRVVRSVVHWSGIVRH